MKKILYVDVDPESYTDYRNFTNHSQREEYTLWKLKQLYDATLVHNLHSPRVDSALEKDNFDLFLTHLPYHPKDFTYEHSIERLKGLIKKHKTKGMKVVVYTGADARSVSDKTLKDFGVSAVIRKKLDDKYGDAEMIRKTLEKLLT